MDRVPRLRLAALCPVTRCGERERLERDAAIEILETEGDAFAARDATARDGGFPPITFTHPFDEGCGRYRLNKTGDGRQSAAIV
jgi:hypothetical protein